MATLTVDRMHTRYVGDAVRYGDCLHRVVDDELDRALAAVPLPAGHVCLRSVTVPVRLGPSGAAARSWAEQIAAALALAVRGGTGVVGYPRTLDALVDLLVSVGRGDLGRAWAWRQLGLVGADPGRPDAAVAALVGRPELACAALAAAAPRGPLPLTAAGWVAVARRVVELAGPPVATGPLPAVAVLDTPVARRLPAGVAGISALPAADRRALGRLLLLCAAPALARSGPAVAAVGELLGRPGRAAGAPPEPGPAAGPPAAAGIRRAAPAAEPSGAVGPDGAARSPGPEPAAGGPGPRGPAAPDRRAAPTAAAAGPYAGADPGPDPDPAPGVDPLVGGPPSPVLSPAGGVLFLVAATGIPDRPAAAPPPLARHPAGRLADSPLSTVMGWLAARLGEVGADDAAVHVLAGQPAEPLGEPTPAADAALGLLAEEVRTWLRELLRLEPDDDLRWLWRRPARIAAEPGWVEATFALDDVDTRVRAAGLDLDPGFVWWLGAVVRYRYA